MTAKKGAKKTMAAKSKKGKKAAGKAEKRAKAKAARPKKTAKPKRAAGTPEAGWKASRGRAAGKGKMKAQAKGKAAKPGKAEKERKKVKRKKGPEEKKLAKVKQMIKAKPGRQFKGRFGKRSTRRKGKAKWKRWRVPRGIDIKRKREHGLVPKTGYRTPRQIRFLHPSGLEQAVVHNVNELGALAAAGSMGVVVVIASKVGSRKRAAIAGAAKEKGIRVVNA